MDNEMIENKTSSNYSLASVGSRFLARLIDCMCILAIGLVSLLIFVVNEWLPIIFFIIGCMGYIILQAYLLTVLGQSIGKKVMNIKIVKYDTGLNSGFVTNFLIREFLNELIGMIPFYELIDALFIFSDNNRCIHDRLANTIVIDVKTWQP
jgi:uncharacterized RDD family membrane protein YckC